MVIALILLTIAVAILTVRSECADGSIGHRDIVRAFAYIHVTFGIILTVILPGASYLFIISGILLLLNELLITSIKKADVASLHLELFITALHLPIILPITLLSISALGLGVSYAFGAVFALTFFSVGVAVEPVLKHISIRPIVSSIAKKKLSPSSADGAIALIAISLTVFLLNGTLSHNAHVNLTGNQTVLTHPYDDALILVEGEGGKSEYRVYDLIAYKHLKALAPQMEYVSSDGESYYRCKTDREGTGEVIRSRLTADGLEIKKADANSVIYLTVKSSSAKSFTLYDGRSYREYPLSADLPHTVLIHSDCILSIADGAAKLEYVEVICDHPSLIPENDIKADGLHFNLWLTTEFTLEK